MKIIRYNEIKPEERPDGRIIYHLLDHFLSGDIKSKFFRVKIPSGSMEKEYLHTNSEEIFIFLKQGQIKINEKDYKLEERDIVIIEKNEKHEVVAKTDMDIPGIKPDLNDKVVLE